MTLLLFPREKSLRHSFDSSNLLTNTSNRVRLELFQYAAIFLRQSLGDSTCRLHHRNDGCRSKALGEENLKDSLGAERLPYCAWPGMKAPNPGLCFAFEIYEAFALVEAVMYIYATISMAAVAEEVESDRFGSVESIQTVLLASKVRLHLSLTANQM